MNISAFLLFLEHKKIQNICFSLLVFVLFFAAFYIRKDTVDVFINSYDQILKASAWLKGDFFWLGPEIPYRQHYLPGPLMYFLLMPPLIAGETPYANSIIWLIIWISMTFTVALSFLKTICKDNLSPFLFAVLLLTGGFVYGKLLFLQWNVIFALFFHLLTLIILYRWIEEGRDFYLSFLGLIMGLGLQLHHSILLHLITLTLFLITSERLHGSLQRIFTKSANSANHLNHKAFKWRHLSFFCMLFLLPQIPYIFSFMNKEIYFPRLNPQKILWLIDSFFLNFPKNIKDIVLYMDLSFQKLILIFPVCIVMYIYKLKTKESRPAFPPVMNLSLICVCPLLAGFLFPKTLYFMGLFISALFVKWHDDLWPENQSAKTLCFLFYGLSLSILGKKVFLLPFWFVQILIIVIAVFLFYYLYSKKHKLFFNILKIIILTTVFFSVFYNKIIAHKYKGSTYQLKELMGVIYEETGWKPEEALNRIFVIGFKPENSFSFAYSSAMEEKSRKKQIRKLKNQGYFIIDQKSFKAFIEKHPAHKVTDYLLEADIPKEMKQETADFHLTFKFSGKTEKYILYNYKTGDNSIFPEGFHNVFNLYKEPEWLKETCYLSGLLKKENTIYFCYLFPGYQETMAFAVNFSQDDNKRTFINVEIYGHPLTLVNTSGVVSHHRMQNVKIELDCSESEIIDIISHIGFSAKTESDFYKSFYAPLKIKRPVNNCSLGKIKQMKLYFESQRGWGKLQKRSFSIKL